MSLSTIHPPVRDYILEHLNMKQPFGHIVLDVNKKIKRRHLTGKQVASVLSTVARKNNVFIKREGVSPVFHTFII